MVQPEETPTSIGRLSSESMNNMSERLSKLENLYFPRAIQPSATTAAQRQSLLLDLLSRDAAVFLGMHVHPNPIVLFVNGDPICSFYIYLFRNI